MLKNMEIMNSVQGNMHLYIWILKKKKKNWPLSNSCFLKNNNKKNLSKEYRVWPLQVVQDFYMAE